MLFSSLPLAVFGVTWRTVAWYLGLVVGFVLLIVIVAVGTAAIIQ